MAKFNPNKHRHNANFITEKICSLHQRHNQKVFLIKLVIYQRPNKVKRSLQICNC